MRQAASINQRMAKRSRKKFSSEMPKDRHGMVEETSLPGYSAR